MLQSANFDVKKLRNISSVDNDIHSFSFISYSYYCHDYESGSTFNGIAYSILNRLTFVPETVWRLDMVFIISLNAVRSVIVDSSFVCKWAETTSWLCEYNLQHCFKRPVQLIFNKSLQLILLFMVTQPKHFGYMTYNRFEKRALI